MKAFRFFGAAILLAASASLQAAERNQDRNQELDQYVLVSAEFGLSPSTQQSIPQGSSAWAASRIYTALKAPVNRFGQKTIGVYRFNQNFGLTCYPNYCQVTAVIPARMPPFFATVAETVFEDRNLILRGELAHSLFLALPEYSAESSLYSESRLLSNLWCVARKGSSLSTTCTIRSLRITSISLGELVRRGVPLRDAQELLAIGQL